MDRKIADEIFLGEKKAKIQISYKDEFELKLDQS